MRKRAVSKKVRPPMPIRLNRRMIYILPTRHGIVFLLVLFAMLLGSVNYNNNLGFLLVFLLGGMVLVSIIHTWRNLLGLKILSVTGEPVFADQTALFYVQVRSDGLFRRGVTYGFEKQERRLDHIPPGIGVRLDAPAMPHGRGFFAPGRFILATRFPLGLFRAWASLDIGAACIIYPAPIEGPPEWEEDLKAPPDSGKIRNAGQRRGADDFEGLKKYQPGDAVQHISWKTFSRGQGLFTKDFTADAGRGVMLDYSAVAAGDDETRLGRLADLVLQASRMKAEYGIRLPGVYLPPATGEQHRHACLKALALFDGEPKENDERSG